MRRMRWWVAAVMLAVFFGPLGLSALGQQREAVPWYAARRDATGLSPDPATYQPAVIQVFAARTVGWRGAFGVHTWISVKRMGAPVYVRYEVMGFGVNRGQKAIRLDRFGPDNYWFGAKPELLAEVRGEGVDAMIDRVEAAVRDYPYPDRYRTWPGPNSNTFVAYVARQVPELRLDLPPNAVGKDFIPGNIAALTPSGTGVQLSLFGLAGVMVAAEEGVELNLLGLTVGIDANQPALKLPGVGRVGF
jgi:hypothetical protein